MVDALSVHDKLVSQKLQMELVFNTGNIFFDSQVHWMVGMAAVVEK